MSHSSLWRKAVFQSQAEPLRFEITLQELLLTVAVCFILSAGAAGLYVIGWANDDMNRVFDLLSACDRFLAPAPATNIVVVLVTEEDFQNHYRARNYSGVMDRAYLARLAEKIAECRPAVLALDFDLRVAGEHGDSLAATLRRIHARPHAPRLVLCSNLLAPAFEAGTPQEIQLPALAPELPAGFNNVDFMESRRLLLAARDLQGRLQLSFAATIVAMKDDRFLRALAGTIALESVSLRARFHRPGRFAMRASGALLESPAPCDLADMIVIVGGAYAAGDDRHEVATGHMPGAEVHANLVDNLLQQSYSRAPAPFAIFLIHCGLGLGIGLLFLRYPLNAFWRRLIPGAGSVLLIAGGWWLFQTTLYWLSGYLAAELTGMLAHKLQEPERARQTSAAENLSDSRNADCRSAN